MHMSDRIQAVPEQEAHRRQQKPMDLFPEKPPLSSLFLFSEIISV